MNQPPDTQEPATRRTDGLKRGWKVGVTALVLTAVALVVYATAQAWDPLERFWTWLDGFIRTPGFAGIAALTAAAVAYLTAARRIRHDREADDKRIAHDREVENQRIKRARDVEAQRIENERRAQERHEEAERRSVERAQRWEVLMWVYDNIEFADPDHLLQVCRELRGELQTTLEKQMLAAVVSFRLDVPEALPDDGGRTQ